MSQYFDVILCGTNILFDNGSDTPVVGFLTARRVMADSVDAAAQHARHSVLVHWNQSYNSDRKLGVPTLETLQAQPVRRWLYRHPTEDYFFFDTPERQNEHLAHIQHTMRARCFFL